VIKNAKTFLNGGVTPREGDELIMSGKIDGIFIGTMWITHPDLAKRVEHGKPLDNPLDIKHLYGNGASVEEQRIGYTNYPEATY
jgi:2,4-dienoyl-CoA reductase-like NADH-dependent reductase (Old Yellow Enzyme family)